MYYTLGEKTLHFYRYQCRYYVAHWDGGHVMTEQFKPFIAGISEKDRPGSEACKSGCSRLLH